MTEFEPSRSDHPSRIIVRIQVGGLGPGLRLLEATASELYAQARAAKAGRPARRQPWSGIAAASAAARIGHRVRLVLCPASRLEQVAEKHETLNVAAGRG